MPFTPKDWRNANSVTGGGDTSTPLNAAALEDLETRVSDYTDTRVDRLLVDVKEEGAAGDGVTDDTTVIQDVLTAGAGKVIYFPPGTYLTGALTAPDGGITLRGAGAGNFDSSSTGASGISILKLKASTDDSLLTVPADVRSVHLYNLQLDGNKANNAGTSHGVEVAANSGAGAADDCDVQLHDCFVHDFETDNFYLGNYRRAPQLHGSQFYSAGRHGVNFTTSDATIDRCIFGLNTSSGIETTNGPTHIYGCDIFRNGIGVNLNSGNAFGAAVLTNCFIDRNEAEGVRINADNVLLSGCYIHSSSRTTDNTSSNVYVANRSGVILAGVIFDALASDQPNGPKYNIELAASATCLGIGLRHATDSYVTATSNDPNRIYGYSSFYNPSAGVIQTGDAIVTTTGFYSTGYLTALTGLRVGNDAAGSSLGSVVKKIEIFDENGASLGYLPVYNTIT